MTIDLVGKKLKIPGKKLRSMWYQAIEWTLVWPFILALGSFSPKAINFLGSFLYVVATAATLSGLYMLARALYWTFATLEINEAGIGISSLSKRKFLYWSDVDMLDFKDLQQLLILKSRSGGLALHAGVSDFDKLFAYILEKVKSNRVKEILSDSFRHCLSEREVVFSGFVVWLVSMYVVLFVDRNKLFAVMLGATFIYMVYLWFKKGKRYIEVKDGIVRNVERGGSWEIQLDQIADVSLFVDESKKSKLKSLELRIKEKNSKSVDVYFRGPQLLPLYLKLIQFVKKEKGWRHISH